MRAVVAVLSLLAVLAGCSRQPPPQRIVHILNYHYVSRDDFTADLRDQDPDVSDAEIGERYAAFLNDVEMVQNEQAVILRGLIREHGIRHVFVEGVTDENATRFRTAVCFTPSSARTISQAR